MKSPTVKVAMSLCENFKKWNILNFHLLNRLDKCLLSVGHTARPCMRDKVTKVPDLPPGFCKM